MAEILRTSHDLSKAIWDQVSGDDRDSVAPCRYKEHLRRTRLPSTTVLTAVCGLQPNTGKSQSPFCRRPDARSRRIEIRPGVSEYVLVTLRPRLCVRSSSTQAAKGSADFPPFQADWTPTSNACP
eukprot:scaffold830_cov377-Prasinococcus_capsulatus_cf.AAC.22